MRIYVIISALSAILSILCPPASAAETTHPSAGAAKLDIKHSSLTGVTAKVESINPATREVTLKGPLGNVVALIAGPEVVRFDEIKVGDEVTALYYISLAGELREPTEDEKKYPLKITEESGRKTKDKSPGAAGSKTIKVVATVVGLDLPTQTVTLVGPKGNTGAIRVEKEDNLKKLRLGDSVIVTYTEAVAVSLKKAEK